MPDAGLPRPGPPGPACAALLSSHHGHCITGHCRPQPPVLLSVTHRPCRATSRHARPHHATPRLATPPSTAARLPPLRPPRHATFLLLLASLAVASLCRDTASTLFLPLHCGAATTL
ncbi:hypothetical protein E2C01_046501 [Portunus trituberculatus]|uniref:Uncharacterized protein n=1 Tax=Portunus trituberculatus TaxID=210409 RepID=A0A5B7G666_PORTR|nr:hypothetical protein [Portunus trituberculatus]